MRRLAAPPTARRGTSLAAAMDGDTRRRHVGAGIGPVVCAALLAAAALSLAGCASRTPHGSSPSSTESPRRSAALSRLEAGRPGLLAVGAVQPTSGGDDAPANGFARALRDALLRDLGAIGVLDAAAPTRIDVAVVSAHPGGAGVDAQVTVTRAGHARLKKRYRAESSTAPAEQSNAVQALLGELYDDPEFNLAVKD